jgi:hypothetical protein
MDENKKSLERQRGAGRGGLLKATNAVARQRRELNQILAVADERTRRLLVGFLAEEFGRGGIAHFARLTGLSPHTIRRGQYELQHRLALEPGRVRRPGAGRKSMEIKVPGC